MARRRVLPRALRQIGACVVGVLLGLVELAGLLLVLLAGLLQAFLGLRHVLLLVGDVAARLLGILRQVGGALLLASRGECAGDEQGRESVLHHLFLLADDGHIRTRREGGKRRASSG